MGSHVTRLGVNLALLSALLASGTAVAADSAALATPAAQAEAAALARWTPQDIVRHIDALERIPADSAAQEVIRILVAIMQQPDAAVRTQLFNRLRPHLAAPSSRSAPRAASAAE